MTKELLMDLYLLLIGETTKEHIVPSDKVDRYFELKNNGQERRDVIDKVVYELWEIINQEEFYKERETQQ